ncbi:uncharacterized protein FTOL_13084 [Fusarium torulosum]|uniref:Uncharacterized protein n=1 Tax=Fusarium torulosum TaxID=33205 RepID=A0AAE8MM02_9HYPO|nr:uncharacterized protein FTOL_13084 [Fusarium torulosum]
MPNDVKDMPAKIKSTLDTLAILRKQLNNPTQLFKPESQAKLPYADKGLDSPTFCQAAYNARHDPQMATLEALKQELRVAPKGTAELFRSVKRLVGRLSEKIRIPGNLVQDSLRPEPLLNSYKIRRVEATIAAKVPVTDGLRNLDSIIRRMLPANDPRLGDMQAYVGRWNGSIRLEDAIRAMYDDEERNHNVHAEIQLAASWHASAPDSTTNITAGMGSVTLSEVEEAFESGDGESDAFADTDSLAHLNDDENVDEIGGVYGDSDEESDGGAGLGD